MGKIVTFILAFVECIILFVINWALLRIWGKVEMDELALLLACDALFFVCRKDLEDITED